MNWKRCLKKLEECLRGDNFVNPVRNYALIALQEKYPGIPFHALIVDAQNTIWLVNAAGSVSRVVSVQDIPEKYALNMTVYGLTK